MTGLVQFGSGDTLGNRTPVTQLTPLPVSPGVGGAAVSSGNPLPVLDSGGAPYAGSVAMTSAVSQTAQRGVAVICTVAGNVTVTFSDASTLTFPVSVGLTVLPFKATTMTTAGATATFANLI